MFCDILIDEIHQKEPKGYKTQNKCNFFTVTLDVTPTDCWLNKHKMGETSGVSKSKSDWLDSTGFPEDRLCVTLFNSPPGNKAVVITTVTMIT